MASSRLFSRRFGSLFLRSSSLSSIPKGKGIRRIQTEVECDPKPSSYDSEPIDKPVQIVDPIEKHSNVKYTALSSLKASARHDLAMVFTCGVCETRSVRTVCRDSYENGIVVVRCGGCNNLHLMADRLGWFGQPGSVEDFLAARGEEVTKGSVDTLSLSPEDLMGTKSS